jgi:hypothetical protein
MSPKTMWRFKHKYILHQGLIFYGEKVMLMPETFKRAFHHFVGKEVGIFKLGDL